MRVGDAGRGVGAQGRRFEQTVSPQVESRLTAAGIRAEVVNLGEPGFTTTQGRKLFEQWFPKLRPDFVILHSYQIKSARESSRNDEASILVSRPGQIPSHLEKESTLFASIDERLSDQFVEIYAPIEWGERGDRERRLARLALPLKETVQKNLPAVQQRLEP